MSAESATYCPSCGTKRTAESRFCDNCGHDFGVAAGPEATPGGRPEALDSLPPPPPPPPKRPGGIAGWGGKQWAIAGGVAAAVLGAVLAIVLIAGSEEEVALQP